MCVFILGTGRSGTNIVLEILSGSSELVSPGRGVEYKFHVSKKYASNSLLKSDIYGFDESHIKATLDLNPHMKIIWTIRDPRDICMSKIRRGVPTYLGGDCFGFSPDGTTDGAVENLRLMVRLYRCFKDLPQCILVKMEDILLDIECESKKLCSFAEVHFKDDMVHFYNRMRNPGKLRRYKEIDKTQIGIWRNWETAYGGYFVENDIDMDTIFKNVSDLVEYFGYDIS